MKVLAIFLIALCLRVIPPFNQVFTESGVLFSTVDAYYQMYLVDMIAHDFPHIPGYLPYLSLTTQVAGGVYFFNWLLAGLGQFGALDTIAAYYPAVLGALVVIPVYFIGKTLFNRTAGLISAGLIAMLPGEFLGRSILGSTDQHVMEVLLSTCAMMFLFMAFKGRRVLYATLAGLFLLLYLITWTGALIFLFILMAYVFTGMTILCFERKLYTLWGIIVAIAGIVVFSLYTGLDTLVNNFFPTGAALTTMEMQPILTYSGNFTLGLLWNNFTLTFALSLITLALLMIKRDNLLLIVWSVLILAAMFSQRRFAYYYAVNVAILAGYLSALFISKMPGKRNFALTCVLLVAFIPNIYPAINTAKGAAHTPSRDWVEALTWLKDNSPEPLDDYYTSGAALPSYSVLSWWDYGYWITRISQRVPVVNPSQNARYQKLVAEILTSENESIGQLRALRTRYIIIDKEMVNGKKWAIYLWADTEPSDDSLMIKLFNQEPTDNYKLVYGNDNVKIWEVKE